MSSSSPKVTVLMPVFNGARYLREALDSILGQTFGGFEFVIINDGSTDTTAAILADYQQQDRRVRVFNQENLGVIASLNRGLQLARGKYIARMDADDVAFPDRLQRQVDFLDGHPDVALVGGAIQLINSAGAVVGKIGYPTTDGEIKEALARGNCFSHPTVVIRRGALQAVQGYRKAFVHAEEYDVWLRLAERYPLANLPEPVLCYRIHENQVSLQNIHQQFCSILGAQAVARIRRETGQDPAENLDRVTVDALAHMGIGCDRINQAFADGCLFWAERMLELQQEAKAIEFLREACKSDERCLDRFIAVCFSVKPRNGPRLLRVVRQATGFLFNRAQRRLLGSAYWAAAKNRFNRRRLTDGILLGLTAQRLWPALSLKLAGRVLLRLLPRRVSGKASVLFQDSPLTEPAPAGRMKILFFTDSTLWSGAENYLVALARRVDRQRFWPAVAMIRAPGTAAGFDELASGKREGESGKGEGAGAASSRLPLTADRLPIPVMHLSTGGRYRLRSLLKSLWWLTRIRPDVVHFVLCGPRNLFYPALAAALLRRRFVLCEQGLHDGQPPTLWERWLKRWLARRALTTICVSREAQQRLQSIYGIAPDRFTVIHNSVEAGKFAGSRKREGERGKTEGASRLPLAACRSRILCTARLAAQPDDDKGHRFLIEAMSELPAAELWLAGDGPARAALEELSTRLGVSSQVKFLGRRSDIPALLAQAAVFCIPSLTESLPFSALEAMAARLPVVAARAGGNPEVVVDGETGFLVEPRDAAALREKLRLLLNDPELRRRMGDAGRTRVEEVFSVERMVKLTCEVWERGKEGEAASGKKGKRQGVSDQ